MLKGAQMLTLDRPAAYQVRVPGVLDAVWADWHGRMTVMVEKDGEDRPITTMTVIVDQAALQGLLRHLYSLGLPLISIVCIEIE